MDAKPGKMAGRPEDALQAILASLKEMAGWPEDALQAILTGLRNVQQLNLSLADRLAVEALLEGEPQGERDQWGRTRKEARAEYLAFTRDRPTDQRGQGRWGDLAVRF